MDLTRISDLLGNDASYLLDHKCQTIAKGDLALPGSDYIDRVLVHSDRKPLVLGNLQRMLNTGRLGGTGYVSILPVDQGIEHSAGASFAPNIKMFDPDGILELAVEGGCNAVASTFGVLGMVSRKYAHKIPFIVKINHNELLSYPNTHDQVPFGSIQQCFEMGAIGVGATIYWEVSLHVGNYKKSPTCSKRRTNWGCSQCCGATCVTARSRLQATTTTTRPTSPVKRFTSA